jgi:hypothetical protein
LPRDRRQQRGGRRNPGVPRGRGELGGGGGCSRRGARTPSTRSGAQGSSSAPPRAPPRAASIPASEGAPP